MSGFKNTSLILSHNISSISPSLSGDMSLISRNGRVVTNDGLLENSLAYYSEIESLQTQIDSISASDLSNYTLISTTAAISASLQSQIDNISGGSSNIIINPGFGIQIVESPVDTFTISVSSDFITVSEVEVVSAGLDSRIVVLEGNPVPDIFATEVAAISSGLWSFTIAASANALAHAIAYADTLEPDLSNYALTATVAAVSAGLDARIVTLENNPVPDIFATEVAAISSGLQNQIDSIVQESTSITSSGGSITITSSGGSHFNIEVASEPIADHNDLDGLQGGTSGEYYHLTANQFTDYIGRTEVASTSGQLVSYTDSASANALAHAIAYADTLEPDLSNYALTATVAAVSAGLDSRIVILENNPVPDIFATEVAAISSGLQSQINSIVQESTSITSSGGSITVTSSGGSHFNIEVASAPIANHNDLSGLQGGTSGEYYHLTANQFTDYIGATEVASISSGLWSFTISASANALAQANEYTDLIASELSSSISGSIGNVFSFTNADLVSSVLTVNHDLYDIHVVPVVYDNTNELITPDNYDVSDGVINVDLTSYSPITGTWHLTIINTVGSTTVTSSAGTTDHNDFSGLQGGTSGEYYHLTANQFSDYIGRTEVTSISGQLISYTDSASANALAQANAYSDSLETDLSAYALTVTVAAVSAGLDSRIDVLEANPVPDIFRTEVAAISAGLQNEIDGIDLSPYALDSQVVHITGNETISGNKTFDGTLTTGTGTVTVNGLARFRGTTPPTVSSTEIATWTSGAIPLLSLISSSAAVNERIWDIRNNNGVLSIDSAADNYGTSNSALTITRSGTSPTAITTTGNVGIGTTNPIGKLVIADGTNGNGLEVSINSGNILLESYDRTGANYIPARYLASSHSFEQGNTSFNGNVTINDDYFLRVPSEAPATSGAAGTIGSITWDTDYVYVCTGTNTWKKAPLSLVGSNDDVDLSNYTLLSTTAAISAAAAIADPRGVKYPGIEWSSQNNGAGNTWQSLCYGDGLFVAVSSNGTGNRVITSPNGINWTSRTSAEDNPWQSVCYGNGLFVAVALGGTNKVMTSPDGITWTARSGVHTSWRSVCYGNGIFVAVGDFGTGNRVMTSPDGITWTSRTSAADNSWRSVCYGLNGLFVAVSTDGTGNRVMTSPDGITWTSRTPAEDNEWRSVCYGNGLFVAVGITGTNKVMTSPDGITWTSRTPAADNQWYSVCYGNGLFVATAGTGSQNRAMTSPDGINWTIRSTSVNTTWASVAYGNGLYVCQSQNTFVMTSGYLIN